jgi:hypothetical protein
LKITLQMPKLQEGSVAAHRRYVAGRLRRHREKRLPDGGRLRPQTRLLGKLTQRRAARCVAESHNVSANPLTLGSEVSGVERVGGKVTGFSPGDEVFGVDQAFRVGGRHGAVFSGCDTRRPTKRPGKVGLR